MAKRPNKLPQLISSDLTICYGKWPSLIINVNPGLINHGLLIRGAFPQCHDFILFYGTFPIQQPRGLLVQVDITKSYEIIEINGMFLVKFFGGKPTAVHEEFSRPSTRSLRAAAANSFLFPLSTQHSTQMRTMVLEYLPTFALSKSPKCR